MSYGGETDPVECHEILMKDSMAVLIDVRTQAEWAFVGMPDLSEAAGSLLAQQWQVYPDMSVDPDFCNRIKDALNAKGLGQDAKLYFLCRSGVRSLAAARAMTAEGYPLSYNVTGGFEGDVNSQGHRGQLNGWKASQLPWRQN